jgi:hypothetical protein
MCLVSGAKGAVIDKSRGRRETARTKTRLLSDYMNDGSLLRTPHQCCCYAITKLAEQLPLSHPQLSSPTH